MFARYTNLSVPSEGDGSTLHQCIASMASTLPSEARTGVDLKIVQKFTHEEENYHDDYTKYHA